MGRAMTIVLTGFIMLLSGFRLGMQDTAKEAVLSASNRFSATQAEFIAESGVNAFLTKLAFEPSWRGVSADIPIAGGAADITVIDRADIGSDVVQIHSRAVYNGIIDSVEVFLTVVPVSDRFSRFSYFSNSEDGIWFYSADTLSGPIHTNGRFNMTGTPVFYGPVSSVSPTYDTFGPTDPRFLGGTDFGRDPIDLSPNFDDLRDAAFNGGHLVLNEKLYLKFQSDGTYLYKVGPNGLWQSRTIPDNGVIAGNRNIFVEGVVNGRVTVATTYSIYITDDIVYADNPNVNAESNDLLGLVAFENIVIEDNAASRDGCKIQAAMLARDGSFKAANINFTPPAPLEIYGGIVQEKRGPVGRLGGPPSGYEKYYQYDERMEYMFPPHYPIATGSLVNIGKKAKISILYWNM